MDLPSSASDLLELKKIQRNVVGTSGYVKVTCVLMFAQGLPVGVISNTLGIDASTAYRYLNTYISGGIDPLLSTGHKGYWGMLDSRQLSVLCKELKAHVYTDAKSASKWVKFAEELSVLLRQKDASSVVYYADGVHPTHNSRSTYVWIEKGCELEQPTVSERDRVNINGLLNLIERLWKFLRKKVINTGFYRTKDKFRKAIKSFFENISLHKAELESFLTLNFRLINSQSISF